MVDEKKGESMEKDHICLREDVEMLIVETDSKEPETVLVIDRSDTPIKVQDGLVVRLKFFND